MMQSMNEKAALLIVDVQAGFINEGTRHVVDAISNLQASYQTRIATRFVNYEGSPFREIMGWHRFYPGSPEVELGFSPAPGTIVLDKGVYTCVNESFLGLLRDRGIDEVHLCGIDTDICVTKCAVDLFEKSIRPVVLADYCASHGGREFHEAALKILRRYIGSRNIHAVPVDLNRSS
jgi:nicotinamidase-related amidase